MTTKNPIRIGGAVVMAALVVAALVAATAPGAVARHGEDHPVLPGGQASNNCTAEFTLPFDQQESEDLDAVTDPEDTWVSDVPDRPGDVQLDVTVSVGGPADVELYNKTGGTCNHIGTQDVGTGPEFEELSDDQKYWPHVVLDDTSASYEIIMEDD